MSTLNGVIIINFSDTLQILNKHKANITNREVLTEKILKIVSPFYSAGKSMLTAIFKGDRGISECRPKTPFPKYELYIFLNKHINRDKLPSLFEACGISNTVINHPDTLYNAIVEKIKLQFENGDVHASENIQEIYLRLIADSSILMNKEITGDEFGFVKEVKYICPLCTKEKLMYNYLTHENIHNFRLIQIYPESGLTSDKKILFEMYNPKPSNFNDGKNILALCPSCAAIYSDSKDYETYKKLVNIKKDIIKDAIVDESIESYDIREAILYVINNLKEIHDVTSMEELSLEAKTIDEKIPTNTTLNIIVKARAFKFFNYITALLSDLERKTTGLATELAQNIKQMSSTLIVSGYSDDEILEKLAVTLNNKIAGDFKTLTACHYIIAYFVAHCEVLTR